MNDKYRVLQDDLNDCGVCSLLSIIKYYNGNVSKEYLRELTKTTRQGVNAFNLIKGGRALGFESYGIKGQIKKIGSDLLPIISHVIINKKYSHFVVIYKINLIKNKILVMDPAKGFVYYTLNDFIKISSGYYLVFKPKQVIPKLESKIDYFKKIYEIIFKYKTTFILIISMSLIYTIINIIAAYNIKILYDSVNSDFNVIIVLLIVLVFIKYIFNYCRNHLIILFNTILDKYLIKDAFYHIIHLPYLYYRNHSNGDLLTRINDLSNIKELLGNLFISVFVDFILAIIIFIFMLNINIKLTCLTIASLLFYIIIVLINSKIVKKDIHNEYEKASTVNNSLIESLSSFETIKNLSIQNYIFNKFSCKYDEYIIANKKLFKRIQQEVFSKNLILEIGNILIIYFGIHMTDNKTLSFVSLITFITLSNYLIEPIKKIMDLHLQYQNTKESLKRIKEIYFLPVEILNSSNRFLKCLNGDIDINDVMYSYNGINNVFNGISLEIKSGERVLIYGNSGCGKSTLMKLLIKYLDSNYNGNITIGGYDLKDLNLYTLRRNICYISQNEYLYNDSIYENITLGKKIKYSLFLDIMKNLSIDEIAKNSLLGYNLVLEDNGENISGGERKRIIIARSVLQKANIYIYDETFSEMDTMLERKILSYLFKLYKDKTFIIISHRFSNEDLFNKKIYMEEGRCEFVK